MKKKFLLGLGSLSILATVGTVAAVASCGESSESDQDKLDAIDQTMVLDALKITVNSKEQASSVKEPTGSEIIDLTINGVSGIKIVISDWTADDSTGTLSFTASVAKEGLNSNNVNVSLNGWMTSTTPNTDQTKMNEITQDQLLTALGVDPSKDVLPPATQDAMLKGKPLTRLTMNTVTGLTVVISDYVATPDTGSVTFKAVISKTDLTSKTLSVDLSNRWETTAQGEQKLVDDATDQQIITLFGLNPTPTTNVPSVAPSLSGSNNTLNGVSGLAAVVDPSSFHRDMVNGAIEFTVTFSKTSVSSVHNVHVIGYKKTPVKTDQDKVNSVSPKLVLAKFAGFVASNSTLPSAAQLPAALTGQELAGVTGLTLTPKAVPNGADDANGSLSFQIVITGITGPGAAPITKDVTVTRWQTTDKADTAKLTAVSQADILTALNINPVDTTLAETAAATWDTKLKTGVVLQNPLAGVSGVRVTGSANGSNVDGSITFDLTFTKGANVSVHRALPAINGWKTNAAQDQELLQNATIDQVFSALNWHKDPNQLASDAAFAFALMGSGVTNKTINTVTGVRVDVTTIGHDATGMIDFNFTFTKGSTVVHKQYTGISGWQSTTQKEHKTVSDFVTSGGQLLIDAMQTAIGFTSPASDGTTALPALTDFNDKTVTGQEISGVTGLKIVTSNGSIDTSNGLISFDFSITKPDSSDFTAITGTLQVTGYAPVVKDGFYTKTGVKMTSSQEAIATRLAAMTTTAIPGTDYFKSTIKPNIDPGAATLPGDVARGFTDLIPSELGLTAGSDGFTPGKMVVYKWVHEVPNQESWPVGARPIPGTGSYQMTTTEDYGVIVNIGGSLKIIAKFSKRTTPTTRTSLTSLVDSLYVV
ncbi:MAG: lipoprotein 17-related variable surface protein [Mycoplasma sp.]|nr:lipoprotein 17-related variable surface protein [Mycoplasma sp.]